MCLLLVNHRPDSISRRMYRMAKSIEKRHPVCTLHIHFLASRDSNYFSQSIPSHSHCNRSLPLESDAPFILPPFVSRRLE
ncbi:hypothetical protein BCR44DRAFT_1441893 [Catenaria anguillulae PL171]|uniref:Uncharacterized protein n=1 Tax=Catenaria anguillulae PL171 TaxID=765915 RepID=A0A1Y2HEX7_9FUNG|nr:hypothetical protein BCR44DRAFT_1441893 [Catenaria anguillulae PL171]